MKICIMQLEQYLKCIPLNSFITKPRWKINAFEILEALKTVKET